MVFYFLLYTEVAGGRPEDSSDCFAIESNDKAYTETELDIRAKIDGSAGESTNVSHRFRVLICFGFWIQLLNFATEITQLFFSKGTDQDDDDYFMGDIELGE